MPPQDQNKPPETSPIEKLNNLLDKSDILLCKIQAVFPFDPFPDTIVVNRSKVDIIYYDFFFVKNVFSMLIKNINSIHLNTSPFFASLKFEVAGYEVHPEPIKFLRKKEATKLRRIVLGLIACDREGIDVSQIPITDLAQKMESIGEVKENEPALA